MPLQPCPEEAATWVYTDPLSGDALRVVPSRGGLVTGWRCGGQDVLYFDAARFADPALSVRGGIPVLFPICGNLPADQLVLPQGTFLLPQHGFARDLPWALRELEPDAASSGANGHGGIRLTLEDSEASRACFPFAFRLELDLRLEPAALAIEARLVNRGEAGGPALPFSFGLHPYWVVSDPAAVRLEGLPARCFDHRSMAEAATTGQLTRLAEGVDFLCHAAAPVRLLDPGLKRMLTLEITPPLDRVVIWSDPPRPMVCLEPWSGPRGALVSGDGRLEVPPGGQQMLACRYRLDPL